MANLVKDKIDKNMKMKRNLIKKKKKKGLQRFRFTVLLKNRNVCGRELSFPVGG